jgi:hypothetical protein
MACQRSLTQAEVSGRDQAKGYVEVIRDAVPGCEHARLMSTGPAIGVRETRHGIGFETLTGAAVRNAVRRNDGNARGAWPIELHPAPGRSTYHPIANRSYFDIPYNPLCSLTFDNPWFGGGRFPPTTTRTAQFA